MVDYGFDRAKVVNVIAQGFCRAVGILGGHVCSLLILLWASVAYVPAGNVGVLTLFGRVTGEVLPEGTHLVNPFKVNNTLSVRTQTLKETASVPSNEGLIIALDTSLLFRLDASRAAEVWQKVGPRYDDVVVEPNLRSVIRSVTSMHTANALYSGEREKVAQQMFAELSTEMSKRGIIVENILLRDIQLPPTLKASIESEAAGRAGIARDESSACRRKSRKPNANVSRRRESATSSRSSRKASARSCSNGRALKPRRTSRRVRTQKSS